MTQHFKILKITERQRQIIIGTLLGDAHLESQTQGKTFRLRIMHAASQKRYLDWLYHELHLIAASPPRPKIYVVKGRIYKSYWFDSVNSASLRFYGHQFYRNGVKIVPKIIAKLLTPLALAVWYMDDGSIKSHETRGRILNTQGFEKKDVQLLVESLLRRFNIRSQLRKQKEGWQIFIPAEMYYRLSETIAPHIVPSMKYKLFFKLDNNMPKE